MNVGTKIAQPSGLSTSSALLGIWILSLALPALASTEPTPALVPAPQKLEQLDGVFKLTPQTRIVTDAASRATGEFLREKLHAATGYAFELDEDFSGTLVKGAILLTTNGSKATLGAEGYELAVMPDGVVSRAPQQAGLFYAAQTFLQLLPPAIFSTNAVTSADWQAPCVRLEDWPRFAWRGMMLDVSRHFQGKQFIERYLDELAMHKLNVFHWHLVDDQGWRLEIKKYPKLTSVGAWRQQPGYAENNGRYGGFYTQEDIREVVAYAAARHITIVPEIEIPGHSQAVLAAYPQFSCSGQPGFVGYFSDYPAVPGAKFPSNSCNVFCASKPETLDFLKTVLSETMDLFPGQYIHIGGDEVSPQYWLHCPQCQALMQSEGLKNSHELQSWLTRRVEEFLEQHHRKLIGWDEILQGGPAPNAAVMSWRGMAGGIAAVKLGHAAVMAPNDTLYFNRAQSSAPGQPPAPLRRSISLATVYNYDPVPAGLTPAQEDLILGAEACLWTEHVNQGKWLEFMTLPRLCALAEVMWSPKAARDWDLFSKRMETHRRRLDGMGVVYSWEMEPKEAASARHPRPAAGGL
jgi:hexosaminidase